MQGYTLAVQNGTRLCLVYWHGLMSLENIGCRLACISAAHFNAKLIFMYSEAKTRKALIRAQALWMWAELKEIFFCKGSDNIFSIFCQKSLVGRLVRQLSESSTYCIKLMILDSMYGGGRKLTPKGCPVTTTYIEAHASVHIHALIIPTHNNHVFIIN